MSILNLQSDGLHSIVITLARVVAQNKVISRDDLISICVPQSDFVIDGDKDPSVRARATLSRWISLGLFIESGDEIRLSTNIDRGESLDAYTERLPSICRNLALNHEHGLPLWPVDGSISEEATGRTADLCRSLAWCLAQDIYTLPSSYEDIDRLVSSQIQPGRFIFLNNTRWPGLRPWARYFGFATGDDSSFFFDPTVAIRSELKEVLQKKETVPAPDFLSRLSTRLPVLDSGAYRLEVEEVLKPETWKSSSAGQLSTALSFALRRLHKQGVIELLTLADAGSRVTLVGQGGRDWESFTHVRLRRDVS